MFGRVSGIVTTYGYDFSHQARAEQSKITYPTRKFLLLEACRIVSFGTVHYLTFHNAELGAHRRLETDDFHKSLLLSATL
jgi:hypothetical protein